MLCTGDIVNVDVTTNLGGFHGDTSATFASAPPPRRGTSSTWRFDAVTPESGVRDGARLGDVGAAIAELAEREGARWSGNSAVTASDARCTWTPMSRISGGRGGMRLRAGMAFTVEPMVNLGDADVRDAGRRVDRGTVDGSLSAQFEHTVLVTKTGFEILTAR